MVDFIKQSRASLRRQEKRHTRLKQKTGVFQRDAVSSKCGEVKNEERQRETKTVVERGKKNAAFSVGGFPVEQRRGGAHLKQFLRSSKHAGGRRDAVWKNS